MFRQNPNLRVLDVREDKEAENMPIPSWFRPVRVGRGVLERDVVQVLPNLDEEILCVCAGGSRSVKAAQVMQEIGYKKVFLLPLAIPCCR